MSYLKITTYDVVSMIVFAAFLLVMAIFAQSFRKRQYNIIGKMNYFFIFSGCLLLICLLSLGIKGLNYGLDFTGGTILELGFHNMDITRDRLTEVILSFGKDLQEPMIQLEEKPATAERGAYRKALIRLGKRNNEELKSEEVRRLVEELKKKFGDVEEFRVESIGPVIGKQLKLGAIYAILIALGLQLIYITMRFGNQMRFGVAADIALFHDLVIMVGFYSLAGRQLDSPFIAALLTVIGYSVMDSIVIFDRIRENIKIVKKGLFSDIVNISVNQTMTRSINTLLTVLLTLFALYHFGGDTLKNFAFALLVGVTSGAYSSIFVASPLLVLWDTLAKKREEQRVAMRRAALAAVDRAKADRVSVERPVPPKPVSAKKTAATSPIEEDYPQPEEIPITESAGGKVTRIRLRTRTRRKGRPGKKKK